MKRWIYISVIVVVVGLVVLLGWYFRYRTQTGDTGQATSDTGINGVVGGGTPFTAQQGTGDNRQPTTDNKEPGTLQIPAQFGMVSQNPVLSYFVDQNNNTTIVEPTGRISVLSKSGESVLSETAIADIASAEFSYDGKKILVSFGDRSEPQTSIFDINKKSWQPLPAGIKNPVWSPTNYNIAYINETGGQSYIFTLNTSETSAKPKEVFRTFMQDLVLTWAYPQKIIFGNRGNASVAANKLELDISRKTTNPLFINKLGLEAVWDKDVNQALVFMDNSLGLARMDKNILSRLGFISLPSKCVFDTETLVASSTQSATSTPSTPRQSSGQASSGQAAKTSKLEQKTTSHILYCGVPRNAEFLQSVLPDAYWERAVFTADEFVRVDIGSNGVKTILNSPDRELDAQNLRVFNKTLFFINRLDQKLYAIELKNG